MITPLCDRHVTSASLGPIDLGSSYVNYLNALGRPYGTSGRLHKEGTNGLAFESAPLLKFSPRRSFTLSDNTVQNLAESA